MEAEWANTACQVIGDGGFAEFMQYLGKDMKDVLPTDLQQFGTCIATEVPSESSCWGALLRDDASQCKPGFVLGKGHFKNKVKPRKRIKRRCSGPPAAAPACARACVRVCPLCRPSPPTVGYNDVIKRGRTERHY